MPPSRLKRCVLGLFVVGAACGGAQRSSAPATSCDQVAQHLVELANQDNAGTASPSLAAGVRGEAARQCRETPWSEQRRQCLLAATTQEQTLACPAR